ncbi:MAG TPA: YceI family protein [Candidatus Dormibacteraeota bacterium]|nr:YceI family protein [Candidatus Dormibacteraeota bacterium]
MKPIVFVAVVSLALSITAVAQSNVWQLDPAHSSAQFAVRHMGISTVRGTFTKLSGSAHYDPADVKNDSVEVTIETASVDTRVEMRDNDLRSDHFFDVQKYSAMTFRSTKIESLGADKLKITGDLTIRGVSKSVSLDVEGPTKPIDDGHGHLHMGVSATGTLNRTDFGMTGYQGVVGNEINLTIDAELVQATPASK